MLVIGIGGGGDAVGCVGVRTYLRSIGIESVVGGVAWERFAVDPVPGPRSLAELDGIEPLGPGGALIDPSVGARTPEGVELCESRVADYLGERTALVDVTAGPDVAAAGIEALAEATGCDLVLLVDIGGDAVANGDEAGLASPLCDAVMIAAGAELDLPCVLGVLGAGCDGELRPAEVLQRVAALAGAGSWQGSFSIGPEAATEIEATCEVAVTEASAMVARCARGQVGEVEIRGGLRTVEVGPTGAICFYFDLELALPQLPLARAVAGADSIRAASDALNAIGVSTELDYEDRRAGGG